MTLLPNTILWEIKAVKQLRKIQKQHQQKIIGAVETLVNMPDVNNVKHLTQHNYGYRLRVGNYRVLFDWESAIKIVSIQEVKKRDERTY